MTSNNTNRIIYYYQTFTGLKRILIPNPVVTHINISSIHFGNNQDGSPYIHLNNNPPDDSVFDSLWKEINQASQLGIKIHVMLGGAGGAYTNLFNNYVTYYPLLIKMIKEHQIISGIDLDIEETVELDNVKKLINNLVSDLGEDFEITMAPLSDSLETDEPGMGGFIYKDLFKSEEGKYIKYFHVQCYNSFQYQNFENMINNGYPSNMIIMGMLSGQDFDNVLTTLKQIKHKFNNMGGAFIWEYYDAPEDWDSRVKNVYNMSYLYRTYWHYFYKGIEWYNYIFTDVTMQYNIDAWEQYRKQKILYKFKNIFEDID